jgi:mRNA interferase MazF
MKRGEIWSVAGGPDYTGKPRPVAILQDDRFDELLSVTFCPFTTNPAAAPLFRLPVQPSENNGLREISSLMVDKITTVTRSKIGKRIGHLDDEDVVRLNRAVIVFLGLGGAGPKLGSAAENA